MPAASIALPPLRMILAEPHIHNVHQQSQSQRRPRLHRHQRLHLSNHLLRRGCLPAICVAETSKRRLLMGRLVDSAGASLCTRY